MKKYDKLFYRLNGKMYTWSGWFGCQLESLEWFTIPAGTERTLLGRRFKVFTTKRLGIKDLFRVRTTWALCMSGKDIAESNKVIIELKKDLKRL